MERVSLFKVECGRESGRRKRRTRKEMQVCALHRGPPVVLDTRSIPSFFLRSRTRPSTLPPHVLYPLSTPRSPRSTSSHPRSLPPIPAPDTHATRHLPPPELKPVPPSTAMLHCSHPVLYPSSSHGPDQSRHLVRWEAQAHVCKPPRRQGFHSRGSQIPQTTSSSFRGCLCTRRTRGLLQAWRSSPLALLE